MNMILLISFSQKDKSFLAFILHELCASKYQWLNVLSQTEAWDVEGANVFTEEVYIGEDLLKEASKQSTVLFLNLQGYSKNSKKLKKIDSFEQFKKSECQIILLVYDAENVEIYIKDSILADRVYTKLKQLENCSVTLLKSGRFRTSLNIK